VDGLIRIVGVQRCEAPENEFILLQNQSGRRLALRGHGVLSEAAMSTGDLSVAAHVMNDDELIPSGFYVMLVTGKGDNRWTRTKDGTHIYMTYMNRPRAVWHFYPGPLHVLCTQHTYVERTSEPLLLR
jgi:hypothetical protein